MVASGVSPLSPSIEDLLRWGADYGPGTTNGQWYRLFTATFVHIGALHLALNMWVLWDVGRLTERLAGNAGFAVLYVLSGLAGSLVSLAWHPLLVSAGASGAIFGVCGALLGFLVRRHDSIPMEALTKLRNSGVAFLAYNLLYGLVAPNIDLAAHLGGLGAGFLCGLALSQQVGPEAGARRPARNGWVAGVGCLSVVLAALALPKGTTDLLAEFRHLAEVEEKAVSAHNAALQRVQKGEIREADMADLLERDVLPPWRAARERFAALKGVPAGKQRLVATFAEYLAARQESWELLVQAIREGDRGKSARSTEKWSEAEGLIRKIKDEAGK
jgi:rhomboid protease GluP